jgi:hypothetical protein
MDLRGVFRREPDRETSPRREHDCRESRYGRSRVAENRPIPRACPPAERAQADIESPAIVMACTSNEEAQVKQQTPDKQTGKTGSLNWFASAVGNKTVQAAHATFKVTLRTLMPSGSGLQSSCRCGRSSSRKTHRPRGLKFCENVQAHGLLPIVPQSVAFSKSSF